MALFFINHANLRPNRKVIGCLEFGYVIILKRKVIAVENNMYRLILELKLLYHVQK